VNVIQPENPGDPVRVKLSVIGGIVTYQTTVTNPGAPPIQLPQGNSVEQLGNQPPTTSNTITEPFVTIAVEGDDVDEAQEAESRNNESEGETR